MQTMRACEAMISHGAKGIRNNCAQTLFPNTRNFRKLTYLFIKKLYCSTVVEWKTRLTFASILGYNR